jgi:squalene-associated FAD-dependent desaturase
VAVVGGGWAGLAAAIEATCLGDKVTLFEMAPLLGGRARTVQLDSGGNRLAFDNGQHILIGAYRESLRLMHLIGSEPEVCLLRTPLTLVDGSGVGLRLPAGPALVAFSRGVLSHAGWRLRDKARLLWMAARWAAAGFTCAPSLTVAELCIDLPQAVRHDLIDPLCVAALNTDSQHASARVFLRVLRDAMLCGPGSADLLLPRRPLGELLPEQAARWLAQHGARVSTSTRVMNIEHDGDGWQVAGERFDAVVVGCTAREASRLAMAHAPAWADTAAALHYEPIITVYAMAPGTRLPQAMTLLHSGAADEGPAQFVFDHGWLSGRHGLLSFVISAAQPWVDAGHDATVDATLLQARSQLHAHLGSQLQALQVLTEKRATFRCTPDLKRPAARIAHRLMAAGDYIEGPYPATLEGAVRSGVHAARSWRDG